MVRVKILNRFVVSLFLLFFYSSLAIAKGKIILDSLLIQNDELFVSFHIEDLFDEKVTQGLERGFVSEIRHRIQLWQHKGFYSNISKERVLVNRLYYDNWTQKYAIVTEDENRLTSNVKSLFDLCLKTKNLPLLAITELDTNRKYYLTIQTTFLPISDETYGELRNWVSGGKEEVTEKPAQRGWIFSFLVDMLGFGNRVTEYRSQDFTIDAQSFLHLNN